MEPSTKLLKLSLTVVTVQFSSVGASVVRLFCLRNHVAFLCYSPSKDIEPIPSAPLAPRHGAMRVATGAGGALKCHPLVAAGNPTLLPMKILLDCCIPAKFKAVKPLKNTNT